MLSEDKLSEDQDTKEVTPKDLRSSQMLYGSPT